MVSPHADWDDVDEGYRRGSTGVFVEAVGRHDAARGVDSSDAGSEAGTYVVSLGTGLEAPEEVEERIARFADPRTAWEFANLLTHYLAVRGDPYVARSELRRRSRDIEESGSTGFSESLENVDAATTLERVLEPRPVPETVRGIL